MENIRNEKLKTLQRVKEEGNFLLAIKRRNPNWIVHILRRNWLLKHFFEGEIEGRTDVKERRGIIHTQLLDELKGK
jgi:hypothetical protein